MFLLRLLAVALPLLAMSSAYHLCDCEYHRGGCVVYKAAPKGFKCKCLYGAWACSGVALPCHAGEACPGDRYSYCACIQGGGDCGGYYHRPSTVESCAEVNKIEASSSLKPYVYTDCECDYYRGGCLITIPAPEGFKCVCSKRGLWACAGWSQGCDEDEYCPGGENTYCGCKRGHGNCGAYPTRDKNEVCNFDRPISQMCNCNRDSDWTMGRFYIKGVTFNTSNVMKSNPRRIQVGSGLDLPNASGQAQAQTMTVTETLTTESSFEHTGGFSLARGIGFLVTLPFGSITGSTTATVTASATYGKKMTTSTLFSHMFTCTSPSYEHTICRVFLTNYDVVVPYTMLVKHKEIPDCECESEGIWKGEAFYDSRLVAERKGMCNKINLQGNCE